jgi:hypothetical protein
MLSDPGVASFEHFRLFRVEVSDCEETHGVAIQRELSHFRLKVANSPRAKFMPK